MNEKKIDLNQFKEFLYSVDIPQIKEKPKTFLGIAKQPHYENVISNIYAFFFNVNEEHRLKDLFIKSLVSLIKTKGKNHIEDFQDFEIQTEYSTIDNGRIDLLITNDTQAIIIENKVYHHLANNLKDYWDSIKYANKNKMGIVLSLKPIATINHTHFINITHLELLESVHNNLGAYLLGANDKYMVFLKDFYQNITNLSLPFMEKGNIEFYYNHQKKINELQKFKIAVGQYTQNEIEKVRSLVDEKMILRTPKGNEKKRLRYFLSPVNPDFMMTILFNGLLTQKKNIHIILEFKGKALNHKDKYANIEFSNINKEILVKGFKDNTSKYFAHYAVKEYELTEEEVLNLSDTVLKKITEEGFLEIYTKMNAVLASEKLGKA